LIARDAGLPPGVSCLWRHGSCSRLIGRKAGQIGFEISKRDQRSSPSFASRDLILLEQFIESRTRKPRELLSLGKGAICFHGILSRNATHRRECPDVAGQGEALIPSSEQAWLFGNFRERINPFVRQ